MINGSKLPMSLIINDLSNEKSIETSVFGCW